MYNPETFGHIITQKRKEAGLTQDMLAKKLGVTPQAVSKWETGAGYPDVTLFPPLAEALGMPVEKLFEGDNDTGTENGKPNPDGFIGPDEWKGLPLVMTSCQKGCYSTTSTEFR